ncbi:MAG: HemK2/MTQ2 family protein methyltransferase [Candidatus Micrarchaeia archaeon]|jgi:release factor glutamine methyltransferase
MAKPASEKTVSFGTLRLSIPHRVYEPAEDSFLLATYASSLSGSILEVGCGSGIVSLSAAQASPKNTVLGVDINPLAVKCAMENARANGIANATFLASDLFSAIPASQKFDFILFNPPYLPTTRAERLLSPEENAAYDGGASGLGVFKRFIAEAPAHLSEGGKVAVIATSLGNGIEKTLALLSARVGSAQTLAEEKFFFERLALLEASGR